MIIDVPSSEWAYVSGLVCGLAVAFVALLVGWLLCSVFTGGALADAVHRAEQAKSIMLEAEEWMPLPIEYGDMQDSAAEAIERVKERIAFFVQPEAFSDEYAAELVRRESA